MTVPEQQDLVDAILADHREVAGLFDQLEASGDARNRGQIAARVIEALVRHTVAEEQFLYPTVRKALPDGDELADRGVTEHADAEQVMKDLSRTDPATPAFDDLVQTLLGEVRRHVAEEERELLPRVRAACDAEQLRELGLKFQGSRRLAPTRPHPTAPDTPPANKVVDLGVGLIDRIRDAMTGRNK